MANGNRAKGLSPRVRGIRPAPSGGYILHGSIPACTGNPRRRIWTSGRKGVYPRVYGESSTRSRIRSGDSGLSPRVRGIQRAKLGLGRQVGSIPACTGNPRPPAHTRRRGGVYPRVYGESAYALGCGRSPGGLSPRVRGIRLRRTRGCSPRRSIPACTGNPLGGAVEGVLVEVYPRVYGESKCGRDGPKPGLGLSPRVRGIRTAMQDLIRRVGSIPACTGNPLLASRRCRRGTVYPRVYGESHWALFRAFGAVGLSPRVRGIPPPSAAGGGIVGSIPACTGNPQSDRHQPVYGAVYPRVYGESGYQAAFHTGQQGLSPRVRGIPSSAAASTTSLRSIPACTGNPRKRTHNRKPIKVYPRVYGESVSWLR